MAVEKSTKEVKLEHFLKKLLKVNVNKVCILFVGIQKYS